MDYIDRNNCNNITVTEKPFKDDINKIPFDNMFTADYELLEKADQLLVFTDGNSDRIYDILVQAKQTNIPSHMITDWEQTITPIVANKQPEYMLPADMDDILAQYEAELANA